MSCASCGATRCLQSPAARQRCPCWNANRWHAPQIHSCWRAVQSRLDRWEGRTCRNKSGGPESPAIWKRCIRGFCRPGAGTTVHHSQRQRDFPGPGTYDPESTTERIRPPDNDPENGTECTWVWDPTCTWRERRVPYNPQWLEATYGDEHAPKDSNHSVFHNKHHNHNHKQASKQECESFAE